LGDGPIAPPQPFFCGSAPPLLSSLSDSTTNPQRTFSDRFFISPLSTTSATPTPAQPTNQTYLTHSKGRKEEAEMPTMFTSVTRLFRRPASPSRSKSKSRHELTSDAHIAYMQAYQRSLQRGEQQQQLQQQRQQKAESSSLPLRSPSSTYSFSSLPGSPSSSSSPLSPFESLCCELRRVEESMGRYLSAPHGCASEPAFFH